MATATDHHALVVGASGLIGWAVVNQLLQPYPSPIPLRKITALVNRPLRVEDALWSEEEPGRANLALVSGVDLLCNDDEFANMLKERVPDIETITHVFYFGKCTAFLKVAQLIPSTAFKEHKDVEHEVPINVGMMRRTVCAIKQLSSNFQFFVYPGGTRVCLLSLHHHSYTH